MFAPLEQTFFCLFYSKTWFLNKKGFDYSSEEGFILSCHFLWKESNQSNFSYTGFFTEEKQIIVDGDIMDFVPIDGKKHKVTVGFYTK